MQRLRLRVFPHIRRCPLGFSNRRGTQRNQVWPGPTGPYQRILGLRPSSFLFSHVSVLQYRVTSFVVWAVLCTALLTSR